MLINTIDRRHYIGQMTHYETISHCSSDLMGINDQCKEFVWTETRAYVAKIIMPIMNDTRKGENLC